MHRSYTQAPCGLDMINLLPHNDDQWCKMFCKNSACQGLICVKGGQLTHVPLDKMAANLADDIFKYIVMKEKLCISIRISLKFVPSGPFNNKPALVQAMAWCRKGDKSLT